MGAEPGRPNELSPITRIDTAAQKLMAHVVARAQCTPLKAHGGTAKAALSRTSLRAGDENRTRMTSLEDETKEALARRFPYV